MSGKVYFVGAPGRIKIGFTVQPEVRLQALRNMDMEELTTIAVIDGSRATEKLLHQVAGPYRLRGEWFMDCPQVRAIIQGALDGKYVSVPVAKKATTESPIETFDGFANPTVLADCKRLADELMNSLIRGDGAYEIKAKAASLAAVSEILVGIEGAR